MGDELIDHRLTLETLPHAQRILDPGGNHAYTGFAERIDAIRAFSERFSTAGSR
jgi:predicted esterase YcpF (UPF0227 family)